MPSDSGADLLAAGLRHDGVRPGQRIVISNIINRATQEGFQAGMNPRQTVLGKSASNALGILGLHADAMEWQWDPMRQKLNIVITVG